MDKQTIQSKLAQLDTERQALRNKMVEIFKEELVAFLTTNQVESVFLYVNNHDFNDGDATYFSLYYEDIESDRFQMKDGSEVSEEVIQVFVDIMDDSQDIHEVVFEGCYGRINISVNNGKLSIV